MPCRCTRVQEEAARDFCFIGTLCNYFSLALRDRFGESELRHIFARTARIEKLDERRSTLGYLRNLPWRPADDWTAQQHITSKIGNLEGIGDNITRQ